MNRIMGDPIQMQREFHHPYTPYPIQLEFMNALYDAIEDGCVGIFESPTGGIELVLYATKGRRADLERHGTCTSGSTYPEPRLRWAQLGKISEFDMRGVDMASEPQEGGSRGAAENRR
jgi:hypothetical protein